MFQASLGRGVSARPSRASIFTLSDRQARFLFFSLALAHALACRLIHDKVLAGANIFSYMGIHWYSTSIWVELTFLLLAVLPAALFIPTKLTRPSDLLVMLLYGMVFVPVTAIIPNITTAPVAATLSFSALSAIGLLILTMLPRLTLWEKGFRGGLTGFQFDMLTYALAIITLIAYGLFSPLTTLTLNLADVYSHRAAFFDTADKLPPILRYVFVNSSLSLAPIMVARGILQRKWTMVGIALVLAYATFLITAYRSMLFGVAFVAAATFLVRLRLPIGVTLLGFFLSIGAVTMMVDVVSGPIPATTFMIHYRIFGNAAVISDGYLSYFTGAPKFYYSQSFLSNFVSAPSAQYYQLSVGETITSVAGNHANGNIVADAFANMGSLGIIAIFVVLSGIMILYRYIVSGKELRAAALALVVPTFSLTNTGLNSTILSGGLALTLVLMALYPVGAEVERQRPRRRR